MNRKILLCMVTIITFIISIPMVNAAEVSVDTNKIYYLNNGYKNYITVPDTYKQEAKITVTGAKEVYYSRGTDSDGYLSGFSVSNDGVVTLEPVYCSQDVVGICYPTPVAGTELAYNSIKGTIIVTADQEQFELTFESEDYSDIYIDEQLDKIIEENITGTTEYEKMQQIATWIGNNTEYSVSYYTTKDMLLNMAGDCWGSSNLIVDLAEKVGIKAAIRSNVRYTDRNAGEGHKNVYAILDGKGYIVEAGYNEPKPRQIKITETDNGFYSGGYGTTIYTSYSGFDKDVYVPENTVTTLQKFTFYYGINKYTQIETLHIPKTITKINDSAISNVPTLKNIIVDEDNPNYKSIDGILYKKDGYTLITYPSGREDKIPTIPSNTRIIYTEGISYNDYIEELILPEGVQTINTKAFTDLTKIKYIDFPSSVSYIGKNAVYRTGVYDTKDAIKYVIVRNSEATIDSLPCTSYTTIFGHEGSTAEEYATSNSCNFTSLESIGNDTSNIKIISEENVTIDTQLFTGEPIIPEIKIVIDGYTLIKDKDYVIEKISNNTDVGSYAYVDIRGIGNYTNKVTKYFEIKKKSIDYTYTNPEVSYNGEAQSPKVIVNDSDFKGTIKYRLSNSSTYTDTVSFTDPGEYKVYLQISGDDNYESVSKEITFKIKGIDISTATVENIDSYLYSADAYYRDIIYSKKVTLNGKVLTNNTDYSQSIEYLRLDDNNNDVFRLVIKGTGTYQGTVYSNEFIIADNYNLVTNYNDDNFLRPGETFDLNISTSIGLPIDQSKFTYSSSSESIVKVDSNGKLSAISEGTATIVMSSNSTYQKTLSLQIRVANERIPLEYMIIRPLQNPIEVNKTTSISSLFYPNNTTDSKKITYTSSNNEIATVSTSGIVTGKSEGQVTITATTSNGLSDSITIYVGANNDEIPLQTITIKGTIPELEVGDTYTFEANYYPTNTTSNKTIRYKSSNEEVATIDSNGLLTAKKVGKTYIVLRASNEYAQVLELNIKEKTISSLTLDKTSLTLEGNPELGNNSYKLTATKNNITGTVSFTTSNNKVAMVSSDGTVTAVGAGSAIITAKVGEYTATCTVIVNINPSSIELTKTTSELELGDYEDLIVSYKPTNTTVKELTWTSSNPNVATIEKNGRVTAKSLGTAKITVTTSNGKSANMDITVVPKKYPITSITLNKITTQLEVGDTENLIATIEPTNTTDDKTLTWTSSDSSIVSVDQTGKITAKKIGVATITVKTTNNKEAKIVVEVKQKVIKITGITINKESLTLKEEETDNLIVKVLPEDATEDKTVTFTSSNPSIVKVENSGKVTAYKEGTATITAKVGEFTKTCTVTVLSKYNDTIPITGITIDDDFTINKNKTKQLTATITPLLTTQNPTITYTSSNQNIVVVDQTGKIISKDWGTAVITATTSNGKTAMVTITVAQNEFIKEKLNGKLETFYYVNGEKQKGFQTYQGKLYFFSRINYTLKTGWQESTEGKWYQDKNGVVQTGLKTIDGKTYYFNDKGIMQTGFHTVNGKFYFFSRVNGALKTGWQESTEGKWYQDKNGVVLTGTQTINNKKYYFNDKGIMQTGFIRLNSKLYFYSRVDGALKTGWQESTEGKWYQDENGEVLTGTRIIDGVEYNFNENGILIS